MGGVVLGNSFLAASPGAVFPRAVPRAGGLLALG